MNKLTGEFRNVSAMLTALKPDEPVYVIRPHELRQAAQSFTSQFGDEVAYPVSVNPHSEFLYGLYAGGIRHFAVTSIEDLQTAKDLFPDVPCSFLHPVKSAAAIREAAHMHGVAHFALDHADELAKIIVHTMPLKPTAIIRLALPKDLAAYDPSGKFGCSIPEAATLMRAAAAEGLGVGLSSRVTTSCFDPSAFRQALEAVGTIVRTANMQPELIVLGGDFPGIRPGENVPPLADYRDIIREGLLAIPLHRPARLMCVPNRALVSSGASLVVKVELRCGNRLYLNDGIHGGLGELRDRIADAPMRAWRVNGDTQPVCAAFDYFSFCGATSDPADMLPGPFALPSDIRMGDYIEIGQMGAYSMNRRSRFGGFLLPATVIVNDPAFLF